jgi:dihydroorotate dehydrogenase (NAD+) catalytic subunit
LRSTHVGQVQFRNPVMTASGTVGHSDELARYVNLAELGAVVVKSVAPFEWAGNPPPRLAPVASGMLNSIGLQGMGAESWVRDELPKLERLGATVVASVWGFGIDDYVSAATTIADTSVSAIEINLSCPNIAGHRVATGEPHGIFAHDASLVGEIVSRVAGLGKPVWAKLSPNTDRLVSIAEAAAAAGAGAVTLVNTALGMALDTRTGRPRLGNGGGGLSGPAIHPIAVRAVFEVHRALPQVPIVGVGGVVDVRSALEMMMAGASAVQVGTAHFAQPRASVRLVSALERWADRNGVKSWSEIVGVSHRGGHNFARG